MSSPQTPDPSQPPTRQPSPRWPGPAEDVPAAPALKFHDRVPYPQELYPGCPCLNCDAPTWSRTGPLAGLTSGRMSVCPTCGDKRCPGAVDHTRHPLPAPRTEDEQLAHYLLGQLERAIQIHAQVEMDTPEDRELHARAVNTMREVAAPVRRHLAHRDRT